MSGIFQGYANSDGRVRVNSAGKVPSGGANDRGMVVAANRVIPYITDTGNPRAFHDGVAFDLVTGLLLRGDPSQTPLTVCMGGLLVDVRGAVVMAEATPDVIHQGVGLRNNGGLCVVSEPMATFLANLRSNVASTAGPGTFTRASDGLYRDDQGVWRIAGPNEPRFENEKYLAEAPSTNTFWNSDAPVTQTRTLNTTGTWTISCYGTGSVTSSDGTGTATGHGVATEGNPVTISVTAAGTFTFTVDGTLALVQVENEPFLTSPIITGDASASRDKDDLVYAGVDYVSEDEGMCLVTYVPRQTMTPASAQGTRKILTMADSSGTFLFANRGPASELRFGASDTVGLVGVDLASIDADAVYRIASRWTSTERQVGYNKDGGPWTWGSLGPKGAWRKQDGVMHVFPDSGGYTFPSQLSDVRIYDQDQGTTWIEDNYP